MIKTFLMFALLYSFQANALTCLKDYGGQASCLENQNTAGDCTTLGYTNENITGCTAYIYCPFNTAYKRCVAGVNNVDCNALGFNNYDKSDWCDELVYCPNDETLTLCAKSCDAFKLTSCPTYGICTECNAKGTTKYHVYRCETGHCLLNDSCSNTICDGDEYPYPSTVANGTPTGSSCSGYRGTDGGKCSGNSGLYYSSVTCKDGYKAYNHGCHKSDILCGNEYNYCEQWCLEETYTSYSNCVRECDIEKAACLAGVYCYECKYASENCDQYQYWKDICDGIDDCEYHCSA